MANTNNAKNLQTQENQRTSALAWKKNKIGVELKVPSGNVALVKRLGPDVFLKTNGIIPDSIAPIIQKAIREGQGLPPEKVNEMTSDPSQILDMLTMMDAIIVKAVVEPAVHQAPKCSIAKSGIECNKPETDEIHANSSVDGWHMFVEYPRNEDNLYVDEIDFEDKSFIMQWVMGGSSDLDRFRQQQEADVANLQHLQNVGV